MTGIVHAHGFPWIWETPQITPGVANYAKPMQFGLPEQILFWAFYLAFPLESLTLPCFLF